MRDETLPDFSLRARLETIARDRFREMGSVVFVLMAVASIHFHEHLSPFMDRIGVAWSETAAKTLRSANLAWSNASLPFLLRS